MRQFQALKRDLLSEEDTVMISGKKHVKRSGWRKISLASNISTVIVDAQHEKAEDGTYTVRVKARATAPNGRFAEEIAVCDSSEFEKGRLEGTLHNIETKAATRAINRAVSDLVGGGEISAEEIEGGKQANPLRSAQIASHPQIKLIVDLIAKSEANALTVATYLGEKGLSSPGDLRSDEASELIDRLHGDAAR
jgi:hypothetical protein